MSATAAALTWPFIPGKLRIRLGSDANANTPRPEGVPRQERLPSTLIPNSKHEVPVRCFTQDSPQRSYTARRKSTSLESRVNLPPARVRNSSPRLSRRAFATMASSRGAHHPSVPPSVPLERPAHHPERPCSRDPWPLRVSDLVAHAAARPHVAAETRRDDAARPNRVHRLPTKPGYAANDTDYW